MNNSVLKITLIFCFLFYLKPAFSFRLAEQPVLPAETADSIKKSAGAQKKFSFWQSLVRGNIDRSFEQALDVSIAGAPYYNQEAGFGLGIMGAGLYRLDRTDSVMPPSNITLSGNVSLKGFYGIYLFGNNYFKGNRSRLSYELYFNNKVLNFWGIDYNACKINPVIDYTRKRIKVYGDYSYKITSNFRIGGIIDFSHDFITKIDDELYLNNEKLSYTAAGAGVSFQYDSRDFIPNPKRGMFILIQEVIYPEALGTCGKTIFRTDFTFDFFKQIWKGGILAYDLNGRFNNGNVPWAMKYELGGGNRMRGYYTGRYIDNNIISTQMELRQHLFKRFGGAAWVGAGTVFPDFGSFAWKNVLPTYGLGLRWEFKHNMNLRIDYAFGKQSGGFILSISEAF